MKTAMSITLTSTATPIPILTPGSEENVLVLRALSEAEATLMEAFETVVDVSEAVVDVALSEELAKLLSVNKAVWLPTGNPVAWRRS
jgi:hypothetical protein